jgi:hypothetical protein
MACRSGVFHTSRPCDEKSPFLELNSHRFFRDNPTKECYVNLAVCCCNSDEYRKICKGGYLGTCG